MTANGANQIPPETSPRRTRNKLQEARETAETIEPMAIPGEAESIGNPGASLGSDLGNSGERLGSDLGNSALSAQHAYASARANPPEPTNWSLISLALQEPKIAAALVIGTERAHIVLHPQLAPESLEAVINQLVRLVSQVSVMAAKATMEKARSGSETDPPVAP